MKIIYEINQLVKSAQALAVPRLRNAHPTFAGANVARRHTTPVVSANRTIKGSNTVPNITATAATPKPTAAVNSQAPAKKTAPSQQPQFNFNQEALKILRPWKRDFKSRPGAYSDNAEGRINEMSRGFKATLADMRKNPQNYSDQRKRQILSDWKRQVQGFKGYLPGESKSVNGAPKYDPSDPEWIQVARGIHIKPRPVSVNNTFRQNWEAAGDNRLVENYRKRQEYYNMLNVARQAKARNRAAGSVPIRI